MSCHCSRWMKTAVLALAATLCAIPAIANFKEDVARDLGPKSASLIAPAPSGSEWLIDADASQGVQTGDLFSVIIKGAPVVNPITKQTIGNLETVKAVLRVTKVKNGYSYAEIIDGKADLKAGEEARRFSGMPAIFWDYAGDGEAVFTQLQGALPHLDWQNYAAAQGSKPEQPQPVLNMEPGLVFVYNDKGLGVKDQSFQPLRFYRPDQVTDKVAVAAAPVAVAPGGASIVTPGSPAAAPTPGALPGSSSPGMFSGITSVFGGGGSMPPGPGGVLAGTGSASRGGLIVSQMDSREGVWYGPRMEGQPIGLEVGDLDGDGKNEVALGFRDRLVVARVIAGKFEPLADYSFGRSGDAVSLNGLDLDGNGRMELYVTLTQFNDVRAFALELQGNKLEQVVKPVAYFLNKVKLGSEGYVLLGQALNPEVKNLNQDMAGPVYRMTRNGDQLEKGTPLDLPNFMSLYGFQPFEEGGRSMLARLNVNDKLQVLEPNGATMWESSDYFGGTETSFERPDGLTGATTRYAFIPAQLDLAPDGTILVPVNEGSRTFGAFRSFNSSHLKAVAFDGYSLVERWRTKPQGGYLGGFSMADADNDGTSEIVELVMYSHGGMVKSSYGNTALLIYEMQ